MDANVTIVLKNNSSIMLLFWQITITIDKQNKTNQKKDTYSLTWRTIVTISTIFSLKEKKKIG